jgi:MFS family permease
MEDSKIEHLEKDMMSAPTEYKEEKYRWVILAISACAMILNGLLNNIIIPIASKLSDTYGYSAKIINAPIIISFLVFSLINIPVNHFLDKRGIKTGYVIGLSFYAVGMFFVCFVNKAFPLLIIGYIVFSFGQPFILNLPAKIATFWFFPRNVIQYLFSELWRPPYWLGRTSSGQD